MDSKRKKKLHKLHAIDGDDDAEMAMLEPNKAEPATNLYDEGVVTLADPVELHSGLVRPEKQLKEKEEAEMKAKIFQHTKMKNESFELGNGVPAATTAGAPELETARDAKGATRWKPTMSRSPTSYFSDGKRLIDYVLAYELKTSEDDKAEKDPDKEDDDEEEDTNTDTFNGNGTRNPSHTQAHSEKRRIFEQNLLQLGLELEYANSSQGTTKFVLVHAPFKVLSKQAELLLIRMPVHRNDVRKEINMMDGCVNAFLKRFKFLDFDESVKKRIQPDQYFCQPFVAQHLDCFVGSDHPETFFSRADRARMVHDLLIRARYDRGSNMDKKRFGIERLVRNNTYSAAYPIHEELNTKAKHVNSATCSDRQLLYETWVRLKNLMKYQPLDLIQKYYGTKIAFYFAWLGFYTRCLYPVSLLGVICVVYGLWTMSEDIPSNDICHGAEGSVSRELLCPACDKYCDYIPLNSTCLYSTATYVFDNYATIAFTVVMSLWMTVFLELWKRYHAELAYRWNVLGYEPDEEVVRPEFQYRRVKKPVINPVTKQEEPYISFSQKALRLCGSGVTVLFFISLVIALLLGIIVYRVIVRQVFFRRENSEFIQSQAVIFTTATAALINLVFILIMNYFYNRLALKLTNWECPRTQSEFDNSFTFKVFLFQFVNFYSSLFYIAFVKGRFAGIPGPDDYADPHEVRIGTIKLEQCEAAGCMVELLIQLIVIMVGKQAINGFLELAYPMFCYWFRRWRFKLPETKKQKQERISREKRKTIKAKPGVSLYEQDFTLNAVYQQFLFDEYLEMVIQLGFCSLFVAAFPLAPFFALINNVFEIRFDAYKFIVTTRRPVPEQARNIGVWLTIINMISNVAVLCNAFVIAFTSDFIPKLYYQVTQGTLHGYINDTLAYFDARPLNRTLEHSDYPPQVYCRYWDLRRPPCSLAHDPNFPEFADQQENCSDNYEFNYTWWIVLSFRLSFVLLFGLVVLSIKAIFAYIIPDMPTKIIKQLQRERFLMRQAILLRGDSMDSVVGGGGGDCSGVEMPRGGNIDAMDRPNLDHHSWTAAGADVDSIAYQPGQDIPEEYQQHQPHQRDHSQSSSQLFKTDSEFDGLRRMFSNRERPSLSPHASRHDLTVISIDDSPAGQPEKSHSSDQLLYQKRRAGAGPTLRWPTPSLLVVPPSLRRPKTVEVLQQATEQLKAAAGEKGEEMGEEEKNDAGQREEKKKSTGSNELV